MLLDESGEIAEMDMRTYYSNQLANDKYLLNQIDKAINVLMTRVQTSEGVGEYTIDTGQDKQTVKASDLPQLQSWKKSLLAEIDSLSRALYGPSGWTQVVPGY